MSGRPPQEIWEEGIDEGERRLQRNVSGLAATGFAGGAEIALGILAIMAASGAVAEVAPQPVAHLVGSLFFGIAFVLITLGRAELFTENFHIPVSAVHARRATVGVLLRMWTVTFVFNMVGLLALLGLLSVDGVLPPDIVKAAGPLADTLADRGALAAFVSAIVAGAVMTLFTWVVAAAESASARVIAALLVGFLLAAPSLNHAVVGFGEVLVGLLTDTTTADVGDLVGNTALAVAGNLVGGVGLVFLTRLAQVRGEPGEHRSGERPA
ncbi:MAG: formate/nitrite transporter family protein [Solirubrobacteraceae bacterium]